MTLRNRGNQTLFFLRHWRKVGAGKGFVARMQNLWSGFLPDSVNRLGLDADNRHLYFPDARRRRVSWRTNVGFHEALTNKLLFQRSFEHVARLPALYGLVTEGRFYPEPAGTGHRTLESMLSLIPRFVAKPVRGSHAKGILFVRPVEAGSYHESKDEFLVNGVRGTAFDLVSILSQDKTWVICQWVENHGVLRDVFPETVNSTRVTTMRDVDTGQPFIAGAYQRFGTWKSHPYEHCHLGALCAGVDPETGKLSGAWVLDDLGCKQQQSEHPDTGAQIAGLVLPDWAATRSRILNMMESHPWFDYVGWDLVIGEAGEYVIEGNHNPGIHSSQMVAPLLQDPRVARFFRSRGIL